MVPAAAYTRGAQRMRKAPTLEPTSSPIIGTRLFRLSIYICLCKYLIVYKHYICLHLFIYYLHIGIHIYILSMYPHVYVYLSIHIYIHMYMCTHMRFRLPAG